MIVCLMTKEGRTCDSSSSSYEHHTRSGSTTPPPSATELTVWEEARCPVCLDHPHNAVLLICSSSEDGCRPFMCHTSYHHSNCFDQYLKAFSETAKLRCPLCRGSISSWVVVDAARTYINGKVRSCSGEHCEFHGTYEELKIHANKVHPMGGKGLCPLSSEEWERMVEQWEYEDLLFSTEVSSSTCTSGGETEGEYETGEDDDDEGSTQYVDEHEAFKQGEDEVDEAFEQGEDDVDSKEEEYEDEALEQDEDEYEYEALKQEKDEDEDEAFKLNESEDEDEGCNLGEDEAFKLEENEDEDDVAFVQDEDEHQDDENEEAEASEQVEYEDVISQQERDEDEAFDELYEYEYEDDEYEDENDDGDGDDDGFF